MSDSTSNGEPSLEEKVAITALVISILALAGVILQYVQSLYGRTEGPYLKDKKVLGGWAQYARYKPNWFRVEMEYEAPVVFLAASNNDKGPVDDKTIWYVNGSPQSYQLTRVHEDDDSRSEARERVHTVKNELATWILVIVATQKMERQSKDWETRKWGTRPLPAGLKHPFDGPVSLAVAIQPMKRSYDRHPALKKAYATTTFCHIIELCAVLGIYEKEFDRDNNKYRAEGNGYSVLGNRMNDFGLVFTFEKHGWPTNEQIGLKTLQLGSRTEIAETLNLMMCNEYTTQCYSDPSKKHVHLFPVVFEVLGMLARPFHIINRPFTFLPNPVTFPLNKQAFSPRRLLEKSQKLHRDLQLRSSAGLDTADHLWEINASADKLNKELPDKQDGDYSPEALDDLRRAINEVDTFLLKRNTKDEVLDVLRRHIQEVLLVINTSTKDIADRSGEDGPSVKSNTPALSSHPLADTTQNDVSFDNLLQVTQDWRRSFECKYVPTDNIHDAFTTKRGTFARQSANKDRREIIWCALVFRMICWLLLHDFDKKDVQLSKSELMGSRLPVFIL
ncbi:hypothetical protein QBC35DRAFT_450834 [Podospora australis]|uniref:Modin n=1 Tax=Podospora australis TaxID=1536484 RepID=A0AAN6WZQ4_9PEZI|nr:hypothetical protein QBC35DRAFT_450834 [Podospora australis]